VPEIVGSGVDLVTFSGDKLLGGPQAGILVGKRALIAAMRKHPLLRAVRPDKLTLAALEATLALYRNPARARAEIPVLAMLGAGVERLRARAEALQALLRTAGIACEIVASDASVGGGAFPTARIPSVALALADDPDALDARLRAGSLPVIGRIADGRLLLDLRSVPAGEDERLASALLAVLA
jgi:L-seryl-tRNA(Ser) seleniumtransferase